MCNQGEAELSKEIGRLESENLQLVSELQELSESNALLRSQLKGLVAVDAGKIARDMRLVADDEDWPEMDTRQIVRDFADRIDGTDNKE